MFDVEFSGPREPLKVPDRGGGRTAEGWQSQFDYKLEENRPTVVLKGTTFQQQLLAAGLQRLVRLSLTDLK